MSKPFLSVYGHVSIDQIMAVDKFPDLNTTVDALSKTTLLGGTGANIATVAATLGVPTAICALVGSDFPAEFEREMEASGLMMDEFVRVGGYDASSAIVVNDGKFDQVVYFFQGPQGFATEIGIELIGMARKSEHVHFCTGEPRYYIGIMEKLQGGPSIGFDPAQEIHRIWDRDTFSEALGLSDVFFCNTVEMATAERYLGHPMPVPGKTTVCTLGARGSVAWHNGERHEIPVIEGNGVVDATGAGDAFRAGYYAGLYRGYGFRDSLIIASTVSSFIVEKVGALSNVPDWDSVMERADGLLGRE
ncbi:MAG: carbohydrate kinase [Thermoplasmatales archaeon]|nr:carbohydrate kinase [Thermoplasmatales archaeon]